MLYITSYGLKFHTMILVSNQLETIKTVEFWNKVSSLNRTTIAGQKSVYETFYWLNSGKLKFDTNHLTNI